MRARVAGGGLEEWFFEVKRVIHPDLQTGHGDCSCQPNVRVGGIEFHTKRDGLGSRDMEHDRRPTLRTRNLACVVEVSRQLNEATFGWREAEAFDHAPVVG